jgi:hypothetical protein
MVLAISSELALYFSSLGKIHFPHTSLVIGGGRTVLFALAPYCIPGKKAKNTSFYNNSFPARLNDNPLYALVLSSYGCFKL